MRRPIDPSAFCFGNEDGTVSGVCAFDVGITVLSDREYGTAFSDGRLLVTGTLEVQLTNLSTGTSTDLNVSGPGVFTETEDGFELKAEGRWFFFFFFFEPGDLGPGSPGVAVITHGLTYLRGDAGGLTFTPSRKTTDICVLLA